MVRKLMYVVENFYLFLTILAITNMLGLYDWFSVLILVIIYISFICIKSIRWKRIDLWVIFFMLYSLLTCALSAYPIALFYYAVKTQVISMLFYFISRSNCLFRQNILDNARPVFFFLFISSIVLYFFPPSFYTEYKVGNLPPDISAKVFYELTRMSGFWPAPYFMGTTSMISIIYISHKIFIKQEINGRNWIFLLLALVCLFFTQMRVAIAYCILFFVILTFLTVYYKLRTRRILFGFWLFIVVAAVVIYFIVMNYMPQEFVEYILNRTIDEDSGLIKERVFLFKDFFKYISLLGTGLGRFGHMAIEYDLPSITDCDYLRLLCELGCLGFSVLLMVVFMVMMKGCKKIRECFCEFFIVGYFLAAMIGAAPLLSINQHSFLFWLCIGRIVQITQRKLKSYENNAHFVGIKDRWN